MFPSSKILGVVLIARHGDRQGFYQDPTTYAPSATSITPLGEVQEFDLGNFIRALYLDPNGSRYIGATSPLFNQSQFMARADAGGEGGVIFDSAIAVTQGLFPPNLANTIKLANGTYVTAPFDGYQYVPIESVEPDCDVSLEGWTSCTNFATKNAAFYKSTGFLEKANESAPFLDSLKPFLDGRPVTLENMWNIYDYMNVQSIHNETFLDLLPPTFLAQARDLANYHEYGIFSDPEINGIGNIAFRTLIPSIATAMQRIVDSSDPLLFHYSAISYKPFLSFFNMSGIIETDQLPSALVNYASALAFELHQPSYPGSEPVIRLQFKNGTDDDTFRTLNFSIPGHTSGGDLPLSQFISTFEPAAVNTTTQWCHICNQTVDRGCAALLGTGKGAHHASLVDVGFDLDVWLLAVICLVLLGALRLGLLSFGRKNRNSTGQRGTLLVDNNTESKNQS